MASLAELERALVNADKAGDSDAARRLAVAVVEARKTSANRIPGSIVPGTTPTTPEPTIGDKLIGAGEAAASVITAIPAQVVGLAAGANALGAEALQGAMGRQYTGQKAEEAFKAASEGLTYAPRTETGRDYLGNVADVAGNLAPLTGLGGELAALGRAAKAAQPAAAVTAGAAADVTGQGLAKAQQMASAIKDKISAPAAPAFGRNSIGAAETPQALQRRVTAEGLPVPFKGESSLTKGQASRDFEQLQFEKEQAKMPGSGELLRERQSNQTATLLQNWDAMVDKAGPITLDTRAIGKGVDQAVVNKANVRMNEVRKLYKGADEAGELLEPITAPQLPAVLDDVFRLRGTASNINAIEAEAKRLGILVADEAGALQPATVPLRDYESLRSFVNDATDWANRREALAAKKIVRAIDEATDGKGGELYQKARAARRAYAQEFENVGITSRLLGTKRGTSERAIAFDDVFAKIVLDAPLEEMNKVRRTLISAGPGGKQAWQDLKAKTIDHIKEAATKGVQTDERGQPVISLHQMNRTVQALDQEGKLEALFGKKQAQQIRDLNEIAKNIYSAPPGAVNHSNTASALRVALDAVLTGSMTGIPVPAATAIKEAAKYVKNRKTVARVHDALGR